MESEEAYSVEDEQQFWDGAYLFAFRPALFSDHAPQTELEECVSADCQTHGLIDNALRTFLSLTTTFRGINLPFSTLRRLNTDRDRTTCNLWR